MQGYVTIDSVIRNACEEIGDDNLTKYRRFELFALDCLRNLKIDTCPEIKTVKVTIDPYTCSVPFPVDFSKWIKIGEKVGDRLKPFIVNNRLIMVNDLDNCGEPIRNAEYRPQYGLAGTLSGIDANGYSFYNYGYYQDTSAAIYGFGAGYLNDGHFREDTVNRRWVFASQFASKEIYIEYISNGIDPTCGAVVDNLLSMAVRYFIFYRNAVNDKNASNSDKMLRKQEYEEQERLAFRRKVDITPDKLITMWRDTYRLTPKS